MKRKLALFAGVITALGFQIFTIIKIVERLIDDKKHHWLEYGCLLLIAFALNKIETAFNVELKRTLTTEEN
jgi:hypothetical protein